MKAEAKSRKQFILPSAKIKRARKILSAKTDTEAVERALDLVIADERIRKILLSVKGTCDIEDVYGRARG
jgi:hypothetical protein